MERTLPTRGLGAGGGTGVEESLAAGEELDAFVAHLAQADAGCLPAAEVALRFAAGRAFVEVDHADLGLVAEALKLPTVLREDGSREAIFGVVDRADGLIEAVDDPDDEDRSEDLFTPERADRAGVEDHGRSHEVSVFATRRNLHVETAPEARVPMIENRGESQQFLQMLIMDDGPHRLHVGIVAETDFELAQGDLELSAEREPDGALHDHALRCRAALTGRAELADHDSRNRERDVCLIADVKCVVAAELGLARDDVATLRRHEAVDRVPDSITAGERNRGDVRMDDERLDDLTSTLDDVEHARGQAGLGEEVSDHGGHGGRVLGSLQDDRVARDERGTDLPERNGEREVVGRDEPDHAERMAPGPDLDGTPFPRTRDSAETESDAGSPLENLNPLRHFALRFVDRLAGFEPHERRDLGSLLPHELDGARDEACAIHRREPSPGREGLLGRRNRSIDMPWFTRWTNRDELPGISRTELFVTRRGYAVNPASPDDMSC